MFWKIKKYIYSDAFCLLWSYVNTRKLIPGSRMYPWKQIESVETYRLLMELIAQSKMESFCIDLLRFQLTVTLGTHIMPSPFLYLKSCCSHPQFCELIFSAESAAVQMQSLKQSRLQNWIPAPGLYEFWACLPHWLRAQKNVGYVLVFCIWYWMKDRRVATSHCLLTCSA